jgi:CpXC protein
MSHSTKYMITCPCGMVFQSNIYEYVNTRQDPLLRYTVLAGRLNVSTCPNCGWRAANSRPFIYSDPAHSLLVYVDPATNISEEARQLTLEKLRSVYQEVSIKVGNRAPGESRADREEHGGGITTDTIQSKHEAPPLHVVFGLEQLHKLINAALSQQERLGRLALRTYSRREAERGQLLDIARKFASEMQCQVDVEIVSGEYTVWLYGSRRQIGAIMRELAPQG